MWMKRSDLRELFPSFLIEIDINLKVYAPPLIIPPNLSLPPNAGKSEI